MNKILRTFSALAVLLGANEANAQITLLKDYTHNSPSTIGNYQGITVREGGFSALQYIPGTDGKEFWLCSDRGPNVDGVNANSASCRPTYDKIFPFPNYNPKIHRVRINGDSIQILRTIAIRRPNGTNVTGLMNPTGLGSTATEVPSTDTVNNCADFNNKVAGKDIFGIDCEAIAIDKDGYFWLAEEGGPTIWKLDQNGKVIKRFTPYANLSGVQPEDAAIDTVFKYRKNNRGFENLTIAPNGKIYALIQSPLLYPTLAVGEGTRVHRLLEIDPVTNAMRMMVYLNDGIIGTGANQIRMRDWKTGDITAINDSTFLVLEAALRGTTDIKRLYKINITGATTVTSGLYAGQTLEALVDSAGLAAQSIVAVKKTLAMDLLANGWPAVLDKAEGVSIINDSTIAITNDNDFGLLSAGQDGIVTATGNKSHILVYRLSGSNKLTNFVPLVPTYDQGRTAQSSSQPPYLVPTIAGAWAKSIITAGDKVGSYTMVGLPDGLGAFDNGNGTFTVVMNHEFGNTSGAVHAHGATGAFVSKWIINKSDLSVVSGADLIQKTYLWNAATSSYVAYNSTFPSALASFGRFCSADLAPVSAYYNAATGKGTQERIFMNGEETGNEGRGLAHIVTGTNAGSTYELPLLGKFSYENSVANPATGDKTVVAAMDDATPGQVYVYIGTKQNTGNDIEKAGFTNGRLYSPSVTGMLLEGSTIPTAGTKFTMVDLGNVQNLTGAQLETNSNNLGVTKFLRPEDGAWDPTTPTDFYFNTTNAFGSPSRVWRLRFDDINDLTKGGNITAVVDGTEGQQMLDNMTVDNSGHIMLVEDVGNNAHIGKVWQYDIAADAMKVVARHDTTRFLNGSANFLTQDEEASGILDVQSILGPGMFLTVSQDHHGIAGDIVEGGQLMAFFNPDTYNSNPEINVQGNSVTIVDGDITPATTDNTDFGNVNKMALKSKTFVIQNSGPGALKVTDIAISGAAASEFTIVGPIALPLSIAAGNNYTFTVNFIPVTSGLRTASIKIVNNDLDEAIYDFSIQGSGVAPKILVQGNSADITDGDNTAGVANNTDFGGVKLGSNKENTFTIQNKGTGELTINGINFAGSNAGDFSLTGAPTFPLVINGGASQNVTVRFAPAVAGQRSAIININNDDATVGVYDFAVEGMGIDPTAIASVLPSVVSMKLHPNPTSANTTLSIDLKKESKVAVSICDIQGREVLKLAEQSFAAGQQQLMLNTASLNSGVYFVQISVNGQSTKVKMVVAH